MTVDDAHRILHELGYNEFKPTIVYHDNFYADLVGENGKVAEIEIRVHFSERLTIYHEREYHHEEN